MSLRKIPKHLIAAMLFLMIIVIVVVFAALGAWGIAKLIGGGGEEFGKTAAQSAKHTFTTAKTTSQGANKSNLSSASKYITKWGSRGSGDGQFYGPGGIGVDSEGNIYVADSVNNRIEKFGPLSR